MEFNELILNKLKSIFQKHNFYAKEQFKNYVKLESENLVIIFSHDKRENSNSFYAGRAENSAYPIDEDVIETVFDFTLQISNVKPEVFVNNLALFFEKKGEAFLDGDIETLKKIETYIYKKSKDYTNQLKKHS